MFPSADFQNAITSDTQVGKISHVAPIYPNQDLVVFPDRGIQPLSKDFKNYDVSDYWLR